MPRRSRIPKPRTQHHALCCQNIDEPRSPQQIVLGLAIAGITVTAVLLTLYGYAAWNTVMRRYLDHVSFRLLVYALLAQSQLVFGILVMINTMTEHPGWQCDLQSFVEQLSLMVSAGMFFCMALNLQWSVDSTCWFSSTDPAERTRWLIGTQTFWDPSRLLGGIQRVPDNPRGISLFMRCTLPPLYGGETLSMMHRKLDTRHLHVDTEFSTTHTSEASRRAGSTILRCRNIILRIGLYPFVSCLLNISSAVIFLHEQNKLGWPFIITEIVIYAGRPLIYRLLAATDPSFIRALHALHHPESEFETETHNTRHSAQWAVPSVCLSTVIIKMPPDESVLGEFEKEAWREQSQITASTSTLGAEAHRVRGQVTTATNTALNQGVLVH
ncbi:hypothetical protein B0H14DRAFT_3463019 [Mycena olivaceomarginata]|nr:hypothetical protein B0H14DRAFT_3463019 [Mycena olivaceomarginata]